MIDLLFISAVLFSAGISLVLLQHHILTVLVGIELMFSASIVNALLFATKQGNPEGKLFALLVFAIAVSETVVAFALLYKVRREGMEI